VFEVFLVYDSSRREMACQTHDLGDATSSALDLADGIGSRPAADGLGPPRRLDVFRGSRVELSIQIIPGGLAPRKGDPKWRSM
jgi:hypothetical protein